MLHSEGAKRAYVNGGAVIRSFLKRDLISDMVITTIPILLGAGLPLFGGDPRDVALKHLRSQAFPSGLVQSYYEVIR
ncbi:dihydrofolate reductase family protein [Rhizobium sp. BR 318]